MDAALQARGIPTVYLEWPRVGHFPHSEQPATFNVETLAALQRLDL
ncbi:hypothetical protein [Hydrogenophaga sp. ANAO-22]